MAAFAVTLVLSGVVYYVRVSERTGPAFVRVLAGTLALAMIVGGATYYDHTARQSHAHEQEESQPPKLVLLGNNITQTIKVIDHLKKKPDDRYVPTLFRLLKTSKSERVRYHVINTLGSYRGERIETVLLSRAKQETAPSLKLSMASELLRRENRGGFSVFLDILESDAPLLTKRKALRKLREATGEIFGYDLLVNAKTEALNQWRQFIKTRSE